MMFAFLCKVLCRMFAFRVKSGERTVPGLAWRGGVPEVYSQVPLSLDPFSYLSLL